MQVTSLKIDPGDLALVVDNDLIIKQVSNRDHANDGSVSGTIVGQPYHKALFGLDESPDDCPVVRSLKTGAKCEGRVSDGNSIDLSVSSYPIDGSNGNTSGAIVVLGNVKDEIQTGTDDLSLFKLIYQDFTDAVGLIDPESLQVVQCNDATCEFMGVTREELLATPIYKISNRYDKAFVRDDFDRLKKNGSAVLERTIRTRSGELKEVEIQLNIVRFNGRTLARYVVHDISEQKYAESRLLKSEAQYRSLVEASPDIIMEIDLNGTILYVNRILKGARNEDAVGSNFLDYLPKEEHIRVRKLLNRALSRRKNTEFEVSVVTPVGTRWWSTRALPQEKDGVLNRFLVITTDVTDTKRAQDALKLSEERYRELVEKSPIPLIVHKYGYIKYVNPNAVKLLGFKRDEDLVGKHIKDFIHPDDRKRVDSRFPMNYKLDEPVRSTEFRLITSTGETRDITVSGIVVNFEGELSRMLMLTDITEQKQAELAVRHSEERYRNLVESMPQPIFVHRAGVLVYVNSKVTDLLGVSNTEDLIGRSILEFVHEEERPSVQSILESFLDTTKTLQTVETRLVAANGDVRDVSATGIYVDYEGEPARLVIINDITELKKVERELRASEQKFRFITENMRDAVFHMDMNFVHHYISPAIEKIRGFTVEDIMVLPIEESLPPASLENAQNLLQYSIERNGVDENGEPLKFTFEQEEYCKDGSKVWTEVNAGFVYDDEMNPVGIIGVTRDISERKEKEKLTQEHQRSLEQIIEHNPYPIVVLDRESRMLSSNKAYLDLFTTTPPDDYKFFEDPHLIKMGFGDYLERARNGEVVEFPVMEWSPRYVQPTGPDITFWIRGTSFPIRNEVGEIEKYVLMYNDVTESRKAEQEMRNADERYRKIVQNLPMGVIIYRGTEIIYANETATEMLTGERGVDLSGRSNTEFIYDGDMDYINEKIKQVIDNPELVLKIRHRLNTANGVIWIESVGMTVVEAGKPARMIFFWEIDEPTDVQSELIAEPGPN